MNTIKEKINIQLLLEQKENILNYLKEYQEFYDPELTKDILFILKNPEFIGINGYTPDSCRQILSKFNILHPKYDQYKYLANRLKELGFLNGNCCEIGAGKYPQISSLILPVLRENKKNLTIYDPKTIPSILPDINLIRENFTLNTNIENIDTLFAHHPCKATTTIIDKAIQENKNLLIAFCGCNHSNSRIPKWIGDYWCEDVCIYYREKYGKEIEIETYPNQIEKYPIMIRKRKQ